LCGCCCAFNKCLTHRTCACQQPVSHFETQHCQTNHCSILTDDNKSNRSPCQHNTVQKVLTAQPLSVSLVHLQLSATTTFQMSALSLDGTEEASTNKSSAAPAPRRAEAAAAAPRFQGLKRRPLLPNPAAPSDLLPCVLSGGGTLLPSCSTTSSAKLAPMVRYANSVSTDPTHIIR
jgi:hypothetical protein